jgi:ubiquinone/menaquinone biosynthesis C-methylase UbiE
VSTQHDDERGVVVALPSYYDDLWEDAPDPLPAYDVGPRRAFLLAHLEPGARVLDLGCGEGDFAAAAAEAGAAEVLGVDVAAEAVRRARARHPGLRFEQVGDALPAPDASFDLVWCSEVLEHVLDTAAVLSEARRVLRTGGALLVTTPAHGPARRLGLAVAGWERHFDPRGPDLRFYTRRSLRELLDDFGFDAVATRSKGRHLFASARRAGIHARPR